jgi:hypothetical protein
MDIDKSQIGIKKNFLPYKQFIRDSISKPVDLVNIFCLFQVLINNENAARRDGN